METLYRKIELKQPGFIQRLFKSQPKQNAIAELNNLLSAKLIKEIKLEEVESISTKYKVDFYKKYSQQLKELYLTYLRHCLEDNLLTDNEIDELNSLKNLLALSNNDVEILHDQLTKEIYKMSFEESISDGRLEKSAEDFLEKLKDNLRLSEEIAKKISAESRDLFMKNFLNKISTDNRLSPDELTEMNEISKSLSVTIQLEEATQLHFEKLKLYWIIENGELPIKQVGINLTKDENCYFSSEIDWLEHRTVTRRINYAGPSVRFKIMKGVYYRAGSVSLQRITSEELLLIDSGTIYLTNKRLIFNGAKKNTTIRLDKILSVVPYSDGISIEKDSGKSPTLRLNNDVDIFSLMLGRLISDLNSSP